MKRYQATIDPQASLDEVLYGIGCFVVILRIDRKSNPVRVEFDAGDGDRDAIKHLDGVLSVIEVGMPALNEQAYLHFVAEDDRFRNG